MQAADNDDDWIGSYDEQYLQAIDAQPDYERQYLTERDDSIRNVWGSFQESATSIAQLYRGTSWDIVVQPSFPFVYVGSYFGASAKKSPKDKATDVVQFFFCDCVHFTCTFLVCPTSCFELLINMYC